MPTPTLIDRAYNSFVRPWQSRYARCEVVNAIIIRSDTRMRLLIAWDGSIVGAHLMDADEMWYAEIGTIG